MSEDVDKAIAGYRAGDHYSAVRLWEWVAQGFGNEDRMREWLREVAVALLDADTKDAGRLRDAAIVRAVGLQFGDEKRDKYRDFRSLAATLRLMFAGDTRQLSEWLRSQVMSGRVYGLDSPEDRQRFAEMTDKDLAALVKRQMARYDEELAAEAEKKPR